MKITSICQNCQSKKIDTQPRKYCSRKCQFKAISHMGMFKKGHKGYSGENNGMWKGDEVGYVSIHCFIRYQYGLAYKCQQCGEKDKSRRYEWANITGDYTSRSLFDWKMLCVPCHRKLDGNGARAWETRKRLYGESGRKFGI